MNSSSPTDPDAPVVLARFNHELEASPLLHALDEQNVRAQMCGEAVAGFRAEVPAEVTIVVPRSQLEAAQQVMDAMHPIPPEMPTADGSPDELDIGPRLSPDRVMGVTLGIATLLIVILGIWTVLAD